ncbi:response regulator [Pedobacter arcticus]|uniref:response regulator n=1 Tax=Pedobacter arcticus TaxID=752140 RepID=UPI0002F004B4|nr:response regulator [Pedobacter arcticus]
MQESDEMSLTVVELKAVLDSAVSEYYILISPDYKILFFNKSIQKVYTKQTLAVLAQNTNILDYIPDEYKKKFVKSFKVAIEKKAHAEEIEFFNASINSTTWLEFQFNPVRLGDRLLGVSVIIRNISSKKSKDVALVDKNKTLQEYAFLTSHKLRAPLTNILGLSSLIDDLDDEVSEDYSKVKYLFKNIQNQAEILDNIIHVLSKLISDNQKMEFNKNDDREIKRIILIDDEPIVTMLNSRMIEKVNRNIERLSFNNPKEALKYLEKNKADLILLDINMPEMNAWEFLGQMRNLLLNHNVIIVSSSINPQDRIKASTYENVKGFLNKPLMVDDLKMFLPVA